MNMNKLFKRIAAVAAAGVMSMSLVVTANGIKKPTE